MIDNQQDTSGTTNVAVTNAKKVSAVSEMPRAPVAASGSDPKIDPKTQFMIRDIMPVRELHLVAGASGAGKTTWLAKVIENWRDEKKIFGHESYPREFLYISGDRSKAGVERTLKRVGVDLSKFPIYPLKGIERRLPLPLLIEKVAKAHPQVRVLFIEGLGSKVPGGKTNDYTVVANFCMDLQDMCEKHDLTIVGVVHSSKTKEGEAYLDPRQQVLGSVAWASYSETIIIMEQIRSKKGEAEGLRRLTILPRNSKEEMYKLEFVGGELVPVKPKETNYIVFQRYLEKLAIGELFTNKEAMDATELNDSSLRLELSKAITNKQVERDKVGHYVKRLPAEDEKPILFGPIVNEKGESAGWGPTYDEVELEQETQPLSESMANMEAFFNGKKE